MTDHHSYTPEQLTEAANILYTLNLSRSAQEILTNEAKRVADRLKAREVVVGAIAEALSVTATTTPTKQIAEDLLAIIEMKGWKQS